MTTAMYCSGTLSKRTIGPLAAMPSTNMRITLTNRAAMMVYGSAWVWKICGPGCTLCSNIAPRITAVAALPGIPAPAAE